MTRAWQKQRRALPEVLPATALLLPCQHPGSAVHAEHQQSQPDQACHAVCCAEVALNQLVQSLQAAYTEPAVRCAETPLYQLELAVPSVQPLGALLELLQQPASRFVLGQRTVHTKGPDRHACKP